MNRSIHRLTTVALLAAVLAIALHAPRTTHAAGSAQPSMRVALMASSGPHTVRAGTLLTVRLQVRGVTLDPKHLGDPAIPGHGHIQIYLDRIPTDATKHVDMKGIVALTARPSFSLGFTRRWLQLHAGSHRLLVALARNDDVLYPTQAAVFHMTVR
jgi:hypothetical protein